MMHQSPFTTQQKIKEKKKHLRKVCLLVNNSAEYDDLVLRAIHCNIATTSWFRWSCSKGELLRRDTWSRRWKYRRSRSIVEQRGLRLIIKLREAKAKCWSVVNIHCRHHPISWSEYRLLKLLQLLVELCRNTRRRGRCNKHKFQKW